MLVISRTVTLYSYDYTLGIFISGPHDNRFDNRFGICVGICSVHQSYLSYLSNQDNPQIKIRAEVKLREQ